MKITVNIPFSEVLKAVKQLTPTQKHLMLKELERLEREERIDLHAQKDEKRQRR